MHSCRMLFGISISGSRMLTGGLASAASEPGATHPPNGHEGKAKAKSHFRAEAETPPLGPEHLRKDRFMFRCDPEIVARRIGVET
jgi:hypothetical protein